jgi:hypothetical protein
VFLEYYLRKNYVPEFYYTFQIDDFFPFPKKKTGDLPYFYVDQVQKKLGTTNVRGVRCMI